MEKFKVGDKVIGKVGSTIDDEEGIVRKSMPGQEFMVVSMLDDRNIRHLYTLPKAAFNLLWMT